MMEKTLEKTDSKEIQILFVDDNPDEFVLMEWLCSRASSYETNLICVSSIEEACDVIEKQKIDIILLDNKLHKNDDFRTSVPVIRAKSFVGPIGIVSSSIEPEYFQEFEQYGADFRIGKNELDRNALGFIIDEFAGKKSQLPDD